MTIVDSVKTCIMQKYACFEGRASRSEYWWFALATYVASMIPVIGWIISLGTLIPSIAVGARRLHDSGKSGWWLLCPFYNLYLCIIAGNDGPNEYGEKPADAE